MTTRRGGADRTAEQAAAGGPPPEISIISERPVSTQPVPGQIEELIAVTYRIAPNPPQVLFVPLEALPDWVFRRDHPDQEVPEAIQVQGDDELRRRIRARRQAPASTARMI